MNQFKSLWRSLQQRHALMKKRWSRAALSKKLTRFINEGEEKCERLGEHMQSRLVNVWVALDSVLVMLVIEWFFSVWLAASFIFLAIGFCIVFCIIMPWNMLEWALDKVRMQTHDWPVVGVLCEKLLMGVSALTRVIEAVMCFSLLTSWLIVSLHPLNNGVIIKSLGWALMKSKRLAKKSRTYSGLGLNAWILIGGLWAPEYEEDIEKKKKRVLGYDADSGSVCAWYWGGSPIGVWGLMTTHRWMGKTPLNIVFKRMKERHVNFERGDCEHPERLWFSRVSAHVQAFDIESSLVPISAQQCSEHVKKTRWL